MIGCTASELSTPPSYRQTCFSRPLLNTFSRGVFKHFPLTLLKKIWHRKNRKSDLSYLTPYLRFRDRLYGPGKVYAAQLSTNGFFEATPKYIFQGGFQAFPANVTQKNLTPKKSKIRPQLSNSIFTFPWSVVRPRKVRRRPVIDKRVFRGHSWKHFPGGFSSVSHWRYSKKSDT